MTKTNQTFQNSTNLKGKLKLQRILNNNQIWTVSQQIHYEHCIIIG
jgi:hypothetical protein